MRISYNFLKGSALIFTCLVVNDVTNRLTMSRQRQITHQTTPFALAQRHLPRELLQEVRMRAPTKRR